MSLEESISNLIESNEDMAESMLGQAEFIEAALQKQEQRLVTKEQQIEQKFITKEQQIEQKFITQNQQVNTFLQEALQYLTLSESLNSNAFLVGGASGYGAIGNAVISAVHPFTKGFEGPYLEVRPSTELAERETDATEAKPHWFGKYDKGPRAKRGGLGGGWQGITNGHLLKITKPAGGQHDYDNACVFALNKHIKLTKFIFRAYVWIESGPLHFGIGPYDDGTNVAVPSAGEWYPINQLISTSEVLSQNNWRIRLTSNEAQEVYIAMPNIFAVPGVGNDFTSMNVEAS